MKDELIIGMLGGASQDGVDAVLVNFTGNKMDLLHARRTPYPAAIRQTLDQLLATRQAPTTAMTSLLDENLGRFFARQAQDLVREAGMEMRDISAIGSQGHIVGGQNVWHAPPGDQPVTIQLGNGQLMAKNSSVKVVGNFHSADLAAGGRGGPLAPLLHQHLFHSQLEDRAVVNINLHAELTLLPANGAVSGFDCGPGTCLLDAWTRRHLQKPRDDAGRWAARGRVNDGLLQKWLRDPYFELPPPERTGLQYFKLDWLDNALAVSEAGAGDIQATLAEFTATTIARGLAGSTLPRRLLVCGPGAHNSHLLGRLAAGLPEVVVDTTARYGADPDWVDGLLFAWLARERLDGRYLNTRAITGAGHPVLAGDIFEP